MTAAAEDGLIRRNPCCIESAGQEHSGERPVVRVSTLAELLDELPGQYRALLLLATFANLRFGELAGPAPQSTRFGRLRGPRERPGTGNG
jgi:hypothetical protein